MDSYLLTSTRTAPLWLLHPLLTTHGSFEAPEGLLDTLGPEPFPTPTATAASRGEAERQGALLHQYLDPKKNGALFSRREVGEPFPLAALQEWLQVDGSSGAQGLSGTQLSISAGRELGWGHPPSAPTFTAGSQLPCSSPKAPALASRRWWGLTTSSSPIEPSLF